MRSLLQMKHMALHVRSEAKRQYLATAVHNSPPSTSVNKFLSSIKVSKNLGRHRGLETTCVATRSKDIDASINADLPYMLLHDTTTMFSS